MAGTEGYNGAYTGPQIDAAIAKAQKSVSVNGGGTMTMGGTIGAGPYTIEMTEEDEGALAAAQVGYNNVVTGMAAENVQDAVTELFTSVSNGKALLAGAITDKGVSTSGTDSFQTMADNVGKIETGTDTSDATVTAGDILSGKTAYGASGKITGTIPSQGATTITPGTSAKTAVAAGRYTTGAVTVAGDPQLTAANIKKGVNIFGVVGTFEGGAETVSGSITVTSSRQFLEVHYSDGNNVASVSVSGETVKITALKNSLIIMFGDAGIGLGGGISKTSYSDGYFITGDFTVS